MYTTSDNYKTVIYNPSTKHLLKIYINDVEINSKYILDYKSSLPLFSNDTFEFGAVTSQAVELKLYKEAVPEKISSIHITSGIAGEEIPMGYFNIDDISKDDDYTVTLKLLDNMIKFEFNYDGSELIYPCSLMTVLRDICSKAEVELGSTSFLNQNKQIAVYDNTVSAREYISYISEQAGGFATIGRDGKLYIKTIGDNISELSINYFKDFKWGEKIQITRIKYEDGVQLFEKGNSTGNTIYINQDNMYIVDQNQIDNIYEKINGLEIFSFEGTSIIDPSIDIGDLLLIDGKYIIYQGSLEYGGKFKASIDSKIQCKAKEETTIRTLSQKTINRRVQSRINQVEGEITLLTQETTENTEKIASIEMDLDSITTRVGNTETKVTSVETIANNAINSATEANSMASNAQETANNASTVANSVKDIAETANSTANTAKEKAEEASAAAEDANLVATNAQEIANSVKSTAENANETANTASTNAANALDIANEAKNTADKAESTADTANTTASNAKEVAENASNIADSAISTANTANSNATTAMNTASEAQSMADSAKTTADEALENANNTTIEMNEKYTEIKSTTESITNTVSDIKEVTNNIDGSIVEIEKSIDTLEQTINGLENTLETQGGSNLLLNSSGLFDNEHWEGNVKALTSTDIQNNFIAKACFNLQNGSMKQTIEVVNGTYYIGFKYQKLLELASCKVLINGIEIELTETNLTEVNNYIEVSEHGITIELVSDTDNACLIGDIIIVKGSKQSWSSNMNEIYTSTVKIGIGLEIVSNTMKTKLLANADGVRIVNTINNKVTSEFTDKGMKTDELEANTAKIARILIQDINKQTWISRY